MTGSNTDEINETAEDAETCRICRVAVDNLIRPCNCRAPVCRECMNRWINYGSTVKYQCEVCNQPLQLVEKLAFNKTIGLFLGRTLGSLGLYYIHTGLYASGYTWNRWTWLPLSVACWSLFVNVMPIFMGSAILFIKHITDPDLWKYGHDILITNIKSSCYSQLVGTLIHWIATDKQAVNLLTFGIGTCSLSLWDRFPGYDTSSRALYSMVSLCIWLLKSFPGAINNVLFTRKVRIRETDASDDTASIDG